MSISNVGTQLCYFILTTFSYGSGGKHCCRTRPDPLEGKGRHGLLQALGKHYRQCCTGGRVQHTPRKQKERRGEGGGLKGSWPQNTQLGWWMVGGAPAANIRQSLLGRQITSWLTCTLKMALFLSISFLSAASFSALGLSL